MSTTVTITIEDHNATIIGKFPGAARTEITITRPSKPLAIAEALTMVAAAHRPEMERAWAAIREQVEPLLAAYRVEVEAFATQKAEQAEEAEPA